jgi:hypothetical protein
MTGRGIRSIVTTCLMLLATSVAAQEILTSARRSQANS